MNNMFYNCQSLKNIDNLDLDTSNITNFDNLFFECNALTSLNLKSLKTTNLNSTIKMFYKCQKLESIEFPENFGQQDLTVLKSLFG